MESTEVGERIYQRPLEIDRADVAALPGLASQITEHTTGRRASTKSELETALIRDVTELHQQAADLGIRPATIWWLWPVDLHSTGPHVAHHIVPACPIGQSYSLYVIKGYGIPGKDAYGVDVSDKGGRYEPKIVLPIAMARDILQQHSQNNTYIQHGIGIYMGDHVPNKQNLADINDSREQMVAHMRKTVDQAVTDWVRGGKKSIQTNDNVRKMVEYLTHYGYMTKEDRPGFMVSSRKKEDIQAKCKNCGTEPEKGVCQCSNCGWIIDPAMAYDIGAITLLEDDGETLNPVGVRTLSRLPREQLEAMGISHHIKLTDEERKAAEKKKPAKK